MYNGCSRLSITLEPPKQRLRCRLRRRQTFLALAGHHQTQLLGVGLAAVDDAHDLAFVEHGDAVAEGQYLNS